MNKFLTYGTVDYYSLSLIVSLTKESISTICIDQSIPLKFPLTKQEQETAILAHKSRTLQLEESLLDLSGCLDAKL